MKSAVIVPTVRPEMCGDFLDSLREHPQRSVGEVYLIAQRGTRALWEDTVAAHSPGVPVHLSWQEEGAPPYMLRWGSPFVRERSDIDAWLLADDDIVLSQHTDWGSLAELVVSGGYGVASGNFVRSLSPGLLRRSWPPRTPTLVPQPFTNTSGGMAVSARVVPYLGADPATALEGTGLGPWLFCDIQVGLTAYLHGEKCVRYRGSLAVHRILSRGGLSGPEGLFAKRSFWPPSRRWVNLRPCKAQYKNGNDWYMPVPSDVTPEAHRVHREAAA